MVRGARSFMLGAAAGAAVAYLFDPDRGRGRRAKAADMVGARVRRGGQEIERKGRYAQGVVAGVQHRIAHRGIEQPEVDDGTLKERVQSILFGLEFPKGNVVVDVVDGVVTLRGQVERPDQVKEAEKVVAGIPGVEGVRNLLHLPGQTPQNVEEARRASSDAEQAAGRVRRETG